MLVADTSVWIDLLNGAENPASEALAEVLASGRPRLLMPDLVLFELLRGLSDERDLRRVRQLLAALPVVEVGGEAQVRRAAEHYRQLRRWGRTIRSSVDALVASWCIEHDHLLLHRDRDFEPYVLHFGLRPWLQPH